MTFENKITVAEYDLYKLKEEVRRLNLELKKNPELYEKRDIRLAMKAMKEFKITGRNLIDG